MNQGPTGKTRGTLETGIGEIRGQIEEN